MKTMKKIATWILVFSFMVSCLSMVAYAADGKIMFTDPQAKAGETVEIKGVVERTSGNMGKIEIIMTYDSAMLKFKSGDGVTETEAGKITYSADVARETGRRKEFVMKFDALKAGTTKLKIASATVKDVSGNTKNYTKGSSAVTIAEGATIPTTAPDTTPTVPSTGTGATVDVNGKTYTISNAIPQNEIPKGYVASTLEYDLVNYNVVKSETSGLVLAYMIGADNSGDFFMYVEEDATFAPYEEVVVSDAITIALLTDVSGIELPEEYTQTTVVLNGQDFPAWQNSENPDFCILYAINSKGETSLYQFDSSEGTYQRFAAPEVVVEEENDSFIGKLSELLKNHLDYVILGTGLGFLLFVLIIVILSVKLYNRNAELDEIYDEYGIDDEEETEDDVVLKLDEDGDDDGEYNYDDEDDEEDDNKPFIGFAVADEFDEEEAEVTEAEAQTENTEEDSEVELFVQEGLKEIFPEIEETSLDEVVQEKNPMKPAEPTDDEEVSIGKVLKQASEKEDKEEFYDDDDTFENFSLDFIDLDEE